MKKNFTINIKTIAMATAAVAMAACSDYSPEEYDGNLTQEEYKTIVEYTKNFEDRYGTIDPNQDWGFGDLEVKEGSRSTRGTVFVNNNEMFKAVKENGNTVDYQTPVVNGQHLVVPGCPSVSDGKYYFADKGEYQDKQALLAAASYVGDGPNIKGDVTNDEIVYVSNWFRTHSNPKNNTNYGVGNDGLIKAQCMGLEEMKLNSFFIQIISGDYDRKSLTDLNYREVKDQNGTSQTFGNMEQLQFKTTKSDYAHINNFNVGNGRNRISQWNPNGYENTYNDREIKWVINDDEEEYVKDFCYWSSDGSNSFNEYVIMYLEFEKNGVTYKGTYLGFDYESYLNGNCPPDGYYNNWIVKISDALPKTLPDPDNTVARVICEDLGNTDDFDFNDLVFDVYYTKDNNSYTAHITVQAVGGTLPIYIGTDISATNELHSRMGYSDMKPINVGATGGHDGVSPCSLTVSNLSTTNPDDIIICVQRGGNQATPTILPKSTGTSSLAPQKICIKNGQGFKWMRESQQIETGYLKFAKWVENKSAFGDNGFWSSSTDIDSRFLY